MTFRDKKFYIEKENLADLSIDRAVFDGRFYYFFNNKLGKLVTRFILCEKETVEYACEVKLIKKNEKFSPRLEFSIRDKDGMLKPQTIESEVDNDSKIIRSRVNLDDCYENFWKLISFLQKLSDIDIPIDEFSLVEQSDMNIISELRKRDNDSIKEIATNLLIHAKISLTQTEINQILNRKSIIEEFQKSLIVQKDNEEYWQKFFENNKWIFGYGLNYQILKIEQSQPILSTAKVDGKGEIRGDYLVSTQGDVKFTVLVEIKTPATDLLQGKSEIRSDAWSLSKKLSDAISQILASIDRWNIGGSREANNSDILANLNTVYPKGILVIGNLDQLKTTSQRNTFQRIRRSLNGIDIVTYDELLNRAKFILES